MAGIKNLGVHFFCRTDRKDAKGEVPIYLRFINSHTRLIIGINRKIPNKKWNQEKQRVIGSDNFAETTNQYLDFLRMRVFEIVNMYNYQNKPFTLRSIRNLLFADEISIKEKTFLEAVKFHNQEMKSLLGKKFSYGSYKNYETSYRYLAKFIREKYKHKDLPLQEIDLAFGKKFEAWLLVKTKCTNNGVMKHIQRLKRILNRAIEEDWLTANPLIRLKTSYKKYDRGYLTENEIALIENATFTLSSLNLARDLFLVMVYTGLSYADLNSLQWKHIIYDTEGKDWIVKNRNKTNVASLIPLLPKAKQLLAKYKNHEANIFPVPCNQVLNKLLKAVGEQCELPKKLSATLGRHTFATTITLLNGVPIESVSKMLGHTKISTTQIYSRTTLQKVSKDMDNLYQDKNLGVKIIAVCIPYKQLKHPL